MSLIDKLLQADADKLLEKPTSKYEVKRLSNFFGEPFVLELQAVPARRYTEIQRMGVNIGKKGNVSDIDLYEMQTMTILEGVKDPDLADKRLLDHFKAVTPKELVAKMFLAGEIASIYAEINKICGYDAEEEVDEEVKN